MIQQFQFLHIVTEETYRAICAKLALPVAVASTKVRMAHVSDSPILSVRVFNICYAAYGHLWFVAVRLDYDKLCCSFDEAQHRILEAYCFVLGDGIVNALPPYEDWTCEYIEYADRVQVTDTAAVFDRLREKKCVPEQLDRSLWHLFKKPHATIEFCVSPVDDTHVDVLARCHSTGLKKRFHAVHHRGVGVAAPVAISALGERAVLEWHYKKYEIMK